MVNDHTQIKFGKNVYINTKIRLPQFDNGKSLAYQAYDVMNDTVKFIAIVAGVESIPRWSAVASYASLADTSFMRLVGSGIIRWPLDNKQKYVFMYSAALGECLVKKGGFSDHSWRHPDIVSYFIQPMARMLRDMSDKSFAHGSVRPSNIFYSADAQGEDVILGDGLSAQSGSTQDALFFPPSIALATPMGRGNATLKGDIYAFGVSLFFFLRKGDAFSNISDEDIVRKKMEIGSYATLIGNERFQASFLELLRGVLHDDENERWGVDEMFSWIDGSRITPAGLTKKKKANRPIVFNGHKYLYAEFLAIDLYKNPHEILEIIEDESLGRWVEKSIDDVSLTSRYIKAMERITGNGSNNKDYVVAQMSLALNPQLPIRYKERCFTYDGFGAMMVETICEGRSLDYYKEVLNLNLPDHAALGASVSQSELIAILKLFDGCRAAIGREKLGYGIERCIYMLCKNAPCLSPNLEGYFVNNAQSALIAFENLSKGGGQISLMIDPHLAALFYIIDSSLMEDISYDLNSSEKNLKVAANLRFMAVLQEKAKIESLPAMAGVFLGSISGICKVFKNKKMQRTIQEGVEKAAKEGNLTGMSALLDDHTALARDKKAFQIVSVEYRMLQKEYDEYNKKLANKKTYGVVNGRNAAAVVSWLASTIITMIVVLNFLAGNRIF